MNSKKNILFISMNLFIFGSYRKKNIRLLSEQISSDSKKLLNYVHKIIYLKFLLYKCELISILLHKYNFYISSTYDIDVCLFTIMFYKYSNMYFFRRSNYRYTSYTYYVSSIYDGYSIYYCYYHYYLYYISMFNSLFFYKYQSKGVASLPTRKSKYTVLRSPHIDKKSREQFEFTQFKKAFKYPSVFYPVYDIISTTHYKLFLCSNLHNISVHRFDYI